MEEPTIKISGSLTTYTLSNGDYHRLDGPAYISITESYGDSLPTYVEDWNAGYGWIAGFKTSHKSKEKLFEFVNNNPYLMKSIELLARHNNWLNEEELLLLSSLRVFNDARNDEVIFF